MQMQASSLAGSMVRPRSPALPLSPRAGARVVGVGVGVPVGSPAARAGSLSLGGLGAAGGLYSPGGGIRSRAGSSALPPGYG